VHGVTLYVVVHSLMSHLISVIVVREMWVIVRYVDIGEIDDHHCLSFPFILRYQRIMYVMGIYQAFITPHTYFVVLIACRVRQSPLMSSRLENELSSIRVTIASSSDVVSSRLQSGHESESCITHYVGNTFI
jgi:hypothetical protein